MLKVWGRRSSFNLQKVMWLVGELGLPHEHIPAGGDFGLNDTLQYPAPARPFRRVPRFWPLRSDRSAHCSRPIPVASSKSACR